MGMSWAMTNADVPELINELITRVSDNKWVILFIINIILLIVGTFMDITPAILIFTPIFLPIAQHLGIDPIHFGIIGFQLNHWPLHTTCRHHSVCGVQHW